MNINENNFTRLDRYYWIQRAQDVQNHPSNANVDIITFLSFCDSWDQAEQHVKYYEAKAGVLV